MHGVVTMAVVSLWSVVACPALSATTALEHIEHVVVIYGENRSFDNLYGPFPKANGIQHAKQAQLLQVDTNGTVLANLPPVWGADAPPHALDPAFVGKEGKPLGSVAKLIITVCYLPLVVVLSTIYFNLW
jgi:phospholipase C